MAKWQDRAADIIDAAAHDPGQGSGRTGLQHLAAMLRRDGDWSEELHPRAADGKFGEGGGDQKEIKAASDGYGAGSKEHNAALAKHGMAPTHMRTVGSAVSTKAGPAAEWKIGDTDPNVFVGRIGKIQDTSGKVMHVRLTGVAGKEFGHGQFHYTENLQEGSAAPHAPAPDPVAHEPAQPSASATPSVHQLISASPVERMIASAREPLASGKPPSAKQQIAKLTKVAEAAEKAHRAAIAAFTAAPQDKDLYRAMNQRQAEHDDIRRAITQVEESAKGPSRKNEFGEWTRKPR